MERPPGGQSARPALEALVAQAAGAAGVGPEALLGPGRARATCAARRALARRAASLGYSVTELAKTLGVSVSAASQMLRSPPAEEQLQ